MSGETLSVVYIHGGSAYSTRAQYLEHLRTTPIDDPRQEQPEKSQRWADTLEDELGEQFSLIKPQMPGKYNAKYEEWKIWFERHFAFVEPEVILVGWSQGGAFLAKYLSENDSPFTVKALFLVAAPAQKETFGHEDGGDFFVPAAKLANVAKKAEKIHILHSKDDPVVPFAHAEAYKKALPEATLHTFNTRGHFLVEKFPELVELIRSVVKKSEDK